MPRLTLLLLVVLPASATAQPASPPAARDPAAAARCAADRLAFGCANAANLEAMADPEDLAAGRALSPARGALEAAAVARLDADKVKELRRESTQSAGGGPQ
jgi:type IV pilus biogenesis protein CpaD/CtpE